MFKVGHKDTQRGLTIFLCLLLFLNSENVYFKRNDAFSALFEIALIAVCVIYIYVNRFYKNINQKNCILLLIISLTYIIIIMVIYAVNIEGSSIANTLQKLAILGILLPLLIFIFNRLSYSATLRTVIHTYINIAALVSFFGLFLWLLFNLGVHLPSIQTSYQWGGSKIGTGILGLTFDVQYSDIQFAKGWSRYTLFYIEGGIAAAYFGLAGILESTCNPHPRMPIILMFTICTFCTLSGFGMIFAPIVLCIGLLCSGHLQRLSQKNMLTFTFAKGIVPLIILITPIIILTLFSQKTNEDSIIAHSNDFTYGFGVFLDRPILGYGIGNYTPLVNTVDGISGTSSSLMIGLIQGGLIYVLAMLLPFICAIALALANHQYRDAVLFATLLLLYVNGISDNSPIYVCMMALAYAYIYQITTSVRARTRHSIAV